MTPQDATGMSTFEYHVLLALASGPLHGYAIKDAVAEESSGTLTPRAGSMYRVIARLMTSALVVETDSSDPAPHPGLARKYYALTAKGRTALATEARRLKQAAAVAEKRLGVARGRS
ncbi:MAG: PadR family transcriptional regulator [bacterium]